MIIKKEEYHQMTSYYTYDIPEEVILEEFASLNDFEEQMINQTDKFDDFIEGFDYDYEDDIWTMRKGGYDLDWYREEDEEEINNEYAEDEERD